MARLLTQVQGRRIISNAVHNSAANLTRFNVEAARVSSHTVTVRSVFQNEASLSRLSNLYALESPLIGGFNPIAPGFALSFRFFNHIARTHPFKTSLAVVSCKAVLADLVAQKLIERKQHVDYKRTGLFFTFGLVYSGGLCYGLYNFVYPWLYASRLPKVTAVASALSDNFINTPFIFFPTFYIMKECFLEVNGSLKSAYRKYTTEIKEAMIASWKIWLPAHIITFGVMPAHLRIPFASGVSFFYYIVVSLQQSRFEGHRTRERTNKLLEINGTSSHI